MTLLTTEIAKVESVPSQDADNIEVLRRILAKEQCRDVTYDEAQAIGESLVEFYRVLAEEVDDGFEA